MPLKKSAHQLFTDRDEPRKAYWDALRMLEERPRSSNVITYYGEGGIGKSWLLSELKRNTERMYDIPPVFDDGFSFRGEYIPVLYNLETSTDTMEILCQLRYALYQLKPDLAFPLFDCAVKKYMDLSGRKLAQPSSSGSLVLEKYGNFLDTAAMFIPGLGTLNSVYSYVRKGGSVLNAALQKIEDKQIRALYKEYFEAISYSETVDDISDNIAEFFKTDLNNSERDYSIAFMIDTFEILTYNTGLKDQGWLTRELAKNTENTLWVFAGRNRIYPEGEENEHLLGDLSREDTLYYLHEKIGITDEAINERIYEISHGTPIFLDICVQNYRNEGKPSIEDYRNLNKELLLKRYIKYLSDAERLVIRLMSSMSHWTDTDYKHVFNAVHSNSFSQYNEAYNRVSGSTMIEKDNEDRYFLHRAVRAGIYEDPDYPAEVKSASLTAILDLYVTRAKEVNNPSYYFDRIIELIRSHASYGEHFSEDDTKLLRDAVYYNLAYFYALGAGRIKEMNAVFDEYLDFLCYSKLSKAHILGVKWKMLNYLNRYSDPVYTDGYSYHVYEKVYGPDHPDTLSCLHGMAESNKNNGKYSEALRYAEELCSRTERLFGKEDNRNLNALAELAGICGKLKIYDRALLIYQDIYDISRSNNNGEENGFSISALEGIARIHKDRNEYKDALEMGKRICAYYVNKYGEFNPNTIRSYNNLAVTYDDMGDSQTACKIYEEVYEKATALFGKDHPGTLVYLSNAASAYSTAGEYDKALFSLKEVFRISDSMLGEDHPQTIGALNSIGYVYKLQGRFDKAMENYQKAYELSVKRFGEDHQLTVTCLVNIGYLESYLEHYDKAAAVFDRVLRIKKNIYGEDHPSTILTEVSAADIIRSRGDIRKALEAYQSAYEKSKRILGENNPDTLKILTDIAYCDSRLGDHESALAANKEIYRLMAEKEGKNTENSLSRLYNVGIELEYLGKYEEALQVMEEVYEGHLQRAGYKCNDALRAIYYKAGLLEKLGKYPEALQTAQTAYNQAKDAFGEDSIDTLVYMSEVGIAYYNVKDYDSSLSVFEHLHAKLTRIYGRDNDHTIDALYWKAVNLYHIGKMEESLNTFEETLPNYLRRYGEGHSKVKNVKNWINTVKKRMDP